MLTMMWGGFMQLSLTKLMEAILQNIKHQAARLGGKPKCYWALFLYSFPGVDGQSLPEDAEV